MICLCEPTEHKEVMFHFTTNSRGNSLETYESKPSTELRINKKEGGIDLSFWEDGEFADVWPVSDLYFKDVNACCLRFPELRVWLEGM